MATRYNQYDRLGDHEYCSWCGANKRDNPEIVLVQVAPNMKEHFCASNKWGCDRPTVNPTNKYVK